MSFRYTSSLIGTLKHKIRLEQSRRDVAQRCFTGTCDGVAVDYSASGSVTRIRFQAPEAEQRFRLPALQATSSSGDGAEGATAVLDASNSTVNVAKLQLAIKAAVFDAHQQLQAAKTEGYRQSLLHNEQLKADAKGVEMWFAQDATTLRPHPYDALQDEEATSYIRSVRAEGPADPLTLATTDRTLRPALELLEDTQGSLRTQRKTLAVEEQRFWRRVELIRKGQQATIRGEKRKYAFETNAAAVPAGTPNVSLRFVN